MSAREGQCPQFSAISIGVVSKSTRTSLRSPDAADHTIKFGAAGAAPAPTQTQELATAARRTPAGRSALESASLGSASRAHARNSRH